MKTDVHNDNKFSGVFAAGDLEKFIGTNLKPSVTSSQDIEAKAEVIKEDVFDKVSSQQKINTFIDQYVVTEEFMNKVRRYARTEIDSMLLGAAKSVLGIALGTAITLLVTLLITGKFK